MKILVIFLVLLVIPAALATNIEYELEDNNVIVSIDTDYIGYFNIELPSDFKNLEIDSDNYILDENYLIINGLGETNVKFSSKSYLEKSKRNSMFISNSENNLNSTIRVILPTGDSLVEDKIIFPRDYEFSTDGKRIIIEWKDLSEKEILLSYSDNHSGNLTYYISLFILLVFFVFYYQYKFKVRSEKTKNLFREEKKIMTYLIVKKECWTKEIMKDLNISKVKLSRKLRILEEKGLIIRTPHGNENRIKLR